MPMLDDLATLLTGVGGSVQLGGLLDAPDAAVALLETSGLEPERVMAPGPNGVFLERAGVQVLARDATYQGARLLAVAAMNALDNIAPATINGARYDDVTALQRPPYYVDRDQNDRRIFAFNLLVTRGATT